MDDVTVTQADEDFARKMADEFLPDMDTPSLYARYGSLLAVIKNGIAYGRRTALADAQGEPVAAQDVAALVEALERIVMHDPKSKGISFDSYELLLESIMSVARTALAKHERTPHD